MESYSATREVRFGVVLYGGVSLAIYMNGVAQELFRLVRATAPALGSDTELRWPAEKLKGSELIYRELGRRLVDGELAMSAGSHGPVRTRFVVDLLSGASAGGINGVFLAKALVNDADLSPLEDLWVDKGDIGSLLNDRQSGKELRSLGLGPGSKNSLLNSRWMYAQLLLAIAKITKGEPSPTSSPYADAVDLWVTMTDLEGRVDVVDTADTPAGKVQEASNRTLLHFSFTAPEISGGEVNNDFIDENNAMLAFAARATSSFPAAFEPMRLADAGPVIEALKLSPEQVAPSTMEDFFPQYRRGDAVKHSFADGGYLDNKPFEQILRTLPLRRSTLPVQRKILYVEPDPGAPPLVSEGDPAARPDLVATVLGVVTTPRNETIADDVTNIRHFGAMATARKQAYLELTAALDQQLAARIAAGNEGHDEELLAHAVAGTARRDLSERELESLTDILDDWSPTTAAYRSMRTAKVADDIASFLARVLPRQPQDKGSEFHSVMSRLVAAMRADADKPPATGTKIDVGAALLASTRIRHHFDTLYHLRRINFLQRRAIDAACDAKAIGLDDDSTITPAAAHAVRRELDKVFSGVRLHTSAVRRPRSITAANPCHSQIDNVLTQFRVADINLDGTDPDDPIKTVPLPAGNAVLVAYRDTPAVRTALAELFTAVSAELNLGNAAKAAWTAIGNEALPINLRKELQRRWVLFRFYDEVGRGFDELPGESSDISIYRISPLDAGALVPDLARRYDKLAGSAVGHFGGFFHSAWRRNDILWGRLDCAERIIDALVPPGSGAARDDLVRRVQLAILTEAWAHLPTRTEVLAPIVGIEPTAAKNQDTLPASLDPTRLDRTALATTPKTPLKPSTQEWMTTAARALRVTNSVTTDLSVGALDVRPVTVFAARIMKFAANVLEFLTGERLKTTLLKNFLVLMTLVGVTIGVIGLVTNTSALTRTGWTMFVGAIIVRVVADTVADRLGRRSPIVRLFWRISTLVLVAGAVGGTIVLHHEVSGSRPLIYTAAPAVVILLVILISNKRFPPWSTALVALTGTVMSLAYYGLHHFDTLSRLVRGKPVP